MYNTKIFKLRHSGDLFEEHCCLLGKDVLDNVFVRDILDKENIPFIYNGKRYKREYEWKFRGDVAKIQIGVDGEYGIVGASAYINYSGLRYEPYVAIEKYSDVFDVVIDMVERAFNWVYKDTGTTIYLEPWIKDEGEPVHWYRDCCEAHLKARLADNIYIDKEWDVKTFVNRIVKVRKKKLDVSPLKKESKKESNKTVRSAIVDQTKADAIMQKIENCMMGKTDPEDFMMSITAAIAAGKLKEFSLTVFRRSFPGFKISSTSFYRLRNPKCKAYFGNEVFEKLVEEFVII